MCQATARGDCAIGVHARVARLADGIPAPEAVAGRIARVEGLTRGVRRVAVALDRPVSFDAGQFMLVGTAAVAGRRAYSMADYRLPTDRLAFVVKQVPEGGFTDWLFAEDRTGSELDLFGPLGVATYVPSLPNNLVCIAGGSGLAPMLSILDHAIETGHFEARHGDLFFGVRAERDIYLLDRLEAYAGHEPERLRVTVVLSDVAPTAELAAAHPQLRFDAGFVHEAAMRHMTGRWKSAMAYLAGPPPMVDATLRALVTEARLTPSAIRYDKFS